LKEGSEDPFSTLFPGSITAKIGGAIMPIIDSRFIAQIRKGIAGKLAVDPGELETLIFTRPKVGYMLSVEKDNVVILSGN